MKKDSVTKLSKKMSWLLRHGAVEAGIEIDTAGWVEIDDVLKTLGVSRQEVDEVVRLNNKSRFEIDGSRIRATQGHSMVDVAIALDDLEASWESFTGTTSLWHGTFLEYLPSIAEEGLHSGARTHVHLAETKDSPVGKRGSVGVLLEVSPTQLRASGQSIFRSPNGVILVRHVPPHCIIGLTALTARAKAQEDSLRALFAPARAN